VLLDRADTDLTNVVDAKDFLLNCTPAANLFSKRADRIHLSGTQPEYHVVMDRTRPVDFEVHSIEEVVGHGSGADAEQPFRPFYAMRDRGGGHRAYYTLRREPRQLSSKQRSYGTRSGYVGNEAYLALVDGDEAPYRSDLKQLAVRALCTNRDLPLHMPVGQGRTDFTLETGAPVRAIRCVAGPTRPRPPFGEGEVAWKLVSHLSLNYLSLLDDEQSTGAAALHEMLKLYADANEPSTIKQIEGLHSATARSITRRIPGPGPLAFGRGLEITLTCDETAFEGTGVFLLGAVLERFFAKYVSINSFAETVVRTLDRGEIMRWPVRTGRRQML
jgi:type VI secretion system protein ImpG